MNSIGLSQKNFDLLLIVVLVLNVHNVLITTTLLYATSSVHSADSHTKGTRKCHAYSLSLPFRIPFFFNYLSILTSTFDTHTYFTAHHTNLYEIYIIYI